MDLPHLLIRDRQDRSWTTALLDGLPTADADERAEIGHTLRELADPRAAAPLLALLLDRAQPDGVRELAGELLREDLTGDPSDATVRRWWDDGDAVLRGHALRSMGPAHADVVVPIAADPAHPLHAIAIEALAFGFETPAHQQLKIAALEHPDATVRHLAAGILVWDEPCAAEPILIIRLDDLVGDVARSAAATLTWYRSRRVLRELATRPHLLWDATTDHLGLVLDFVAELRRLPPAARPALERWMAPVADLLDEELARPEEAPRPPDVERDLSEVLDPDQLLDGLTAVDGAWGTTRDLLDEVRPDRVEPVDRVRLGRAAREHVDPEVRGHAAVWLGTWGDADGVRALLDDPAFIVRKAAGWACSLLPPDPALAARLHARLDEPGTHGTHANELLASYLVHAGRDEAIATLTRIAHEDDREGRVFGAVHGLMELGARAPLVGLMPRLVRPPLVTWLVHATLLQAARTLGLDTAAARLELAGVDDLELQVQLAHLDAP